MATAWHGVKLYVKSALDGGAGGGDDVSMLDAQASRPVSAATSNEVP